MRQAIATVCTICCLSACSVPIGPIAGGALPGEISGWPEDWAFTSDIENILLQTNPRDPYSVTIWVIEVGGSLYIGASSQENTWAKNILDNPQVVVSIADKLYEARAVAVNDEEEATAALTKFTTKYDIDIDPSSDGMFFRLDPRL